MPEAAAAVPSLLLVRLEALCPLSATHPECASINEPGPPQVGQSDASMALQPACSTRVIGALPQSVRLGCAAFQACIGGWSARRGSRASCPMRSPLSSTFFNYCTCPLVHPLACLLRAFDVASQKIRSVWGEGGAGCLSRPAQLGRCGAPYGVLSHATGAERPSGWLLPSFNDLCSVQRRFELLVFNLLLFSLQTHPNCGRREDGKTQNISRA